MKAPLLKAPLVWQAAFYVAPGSAVQNLHKTVGKVKRRIPDDF